MSARTIDVVPPTHSPRLPPRVSPSPAPVVELPETPAEHEAEQDRVSRDLGPAVDPAHVEPVGTTLGEPAKEHWDTKQPEDSSDSSP